MNSVSLGATLVALTVSPLLAAQPDTHGEGSLSDATSPEPARLPRVSVTVVGMQAEAIERALGPNLKSSYALVITSAERFEPEQLFSKRIESQSSIHVWVNTTTGRKADLYFVNLEGTRYLVRTIEISSPFDEMDSESLAQAIEWSLQALVEGSAGLTRAEAQSLLGETGKPPVNATSERAVEPRSLNDWRRRTTGWIPELALLHRWTPHSEELPAAQGPVLRLGLDRLSPGRQLGFAVSAQYVYPQRHAQFGVALDVQSLASRIETRYLSTTLIDGSAIGPSLGLGLDFEFPSAIALDYARLEAASNGANCIPLATTSFVWQLRVEPGLRLEFSIGAELDFARVHYDVETNGGTLKLVSRWPARPSVSIGVELF